MSSPSLAVSSDSRSHSGCVLHQDINPIESRPFHPMTIRPLIPEIQFDLENSRSKVKVNGTPVSAASSWFISFVFHIKASYRLLYLLFHDNRASHSRDTIWPWKFKVNGQDQMYPSQRSIQFTSFLFSTQIGPTIPKIWQIECSTGENKFKILQKKSPKIFIWRIGWVVFTFSRGKCKLRFASAA